MNSIEHPKERYHMSYHPYDHALLHPRIKIFSYVTYVTHSPEKGIGSKTEMNIHSYETLDPFLDT